VKLVPSLVRVDGSVRVLPLELTIVIRVTLDPNDPMRPFVPEIVVYYHPILR
jgi:hypothetical protein